MSPEPKDKKLLFWSTPETANAGRFTVLGKVVQNLPGVVMRLLPTDRIVSIRIYEGNGSEPLAPAR